MICYMITIVAKWLLGQSWPLLTKLLTYLKTKLPTLVKRINKLTEWLNEQLKKFKATIDAIKRILVRLYVKIKNLISYLIALFNPTKKYSPKTNTSLIIGLVGSATVATFLTRNSSTGPTKIFLQLTILLIFLGLYQILVFFQKMYIWN